MIQELEFQRADGLTIRGKLYIPEKEKGKKPYPLAVFCNGLGRNSHMAWPLGIGMIEEGISVFLFDFCGGSLECSSDGCMQEMTIRTECTDLRTVLEGLWKLPSIDRYNTFLMGENQGAVVAALTGARLHSRIKGLILWSPSFNLPARIRKSFPKVQSEARRLYAAELGNAYYREGKNIDISAAAAAYAGPVLLVHGEADELVPLQESETFMDIYENAQLIIIPGGKHCFTEEDFRRAREYSTVFIKEHALEKL